VPGSTVPRGTPQSLIWKRKLWELHTGWLGLALSVVSAWLITNGMKNMFGKPRPDLLARCHADIDNIAKYIVGGYNNFSSNGQLVRAEICTNPDKAILDDGFRSYPSGHSSSSAAG
jgi:membrane-associated phospholipid phosphatase